MTDLTTLGGVIGIDDCRIKGAAMTAIQMEQVVFRIGSLRSKCYEVAVEAVAVTPGANSKVLVVLGVVAIIPFTLLDAHMDNGVDISLGSGAVAFEAVQIGVFLVILHACLVAADTNLGTFERNNTSANQGWCVDRALVGVIPHVRGGVRIIVYIGDRGMAARAVVRRDLRTGGMLTVVRYMAAGKKTGCISAIRKVAVTFLIIDRMRSGKHPNQHTTGREIH